MSFRIRLIVPILIILVAAFLRFYKLEEFVTFLGDQGRDAIIIKRIVTFEHFPAIGPPSSLGQIFLGPFYYYLIAPFLLLFSFNPVGLAFGVALLSIIGIIISYLIVKKEVNHLAALIFLFFLAFSTVNIQFSRFSWNPNLLPIFSFFTLYFFYKLLTTKSKWNALAFGAFLSFSIQLHHLAFLLIIPIFFTYILYFYITAKSHSGKSRKGRDASRIVVQNRLRFRTSRNDFINLMFSLISFLFFSLPLIIFDLRHNFLNTQNLIKFFTEGNPTDREQFFKRFLETIAYFYNHIFQLNINSYLALFLTIFILLFVLKKSLSQKYLFIHIHSLNFIFFIFAFSFFNSSRNAHYFSAVYLSFFLVLSWFITNIAKNKTVQFLLIFLTISIFVSFNIESLKYLFFIAGNYQIKKAQNIAESILQKNPQIPFQTIALPYVETDGHIRYFLEIKGKRPLPSDTLSDPIELYVLCFEKDCQVSGNPQWQIAAFKNATVDKIWTVEGIKIYKLTHTTSHSGER